MKRVNVLSYTLLLLINLTIEYLSACLLIYLFIYSQFSYLTYLNYSATSVLSTYCIYVSSVFLNV